MMPRFLLLLAIACPVVASPPGSWESIDPDLDIMGLLDDEPEGISMIQRDSRLQGAAAGSLCKGSTCSAGRKDDELPMDESLASLFSMEDGEEEGVSLVQVRAAYVLKQPVL